MDIRLAVFVTSADHVRKCPDPGKPEFAFIGRSNVGKSSLINMLTGVKKLAHTSSKPGKTQLINHFLINDQWYLVDLPGYGYAKVAKTQREKWSKMIKGYVRHRENLMCLFVLVDSRIPFQANDHEFINQLGEAGVPFALIYTKTDKVKKTEMEAHFRDMEEKLMTTWNALPPVLYSSAEKGTGKKEILEYIASIIPAFQK